MRLKSSSSFVEYPAAPCPLRAAADLLARVRDRQPQVHCLTNAVALELSANVLLALGAEPSMTGDAATVAEFVRGCDALVVNLGMLEPVRAVAIEVAVRTAADSGRPWLLDPVKVDRSGSRRDFARALLRTPPAVLRGNTAEIAALAGIGAEPAQALAARHGCVVAATGREDLVVDETR